MKSSKDFHVVGLIVTDN